MRDDMRERFSISLRNPWQFLKRFSCAIDALKYMREDDMAEVKDHGNKGETIKLSKADLDKAKDANEEHHKRFTLKVRDK